MTPRTFPALLADRLRTDPGQPLVTAYDEESGERTELSVTTYANWVSKTANLLTDELGLDAGDTVLLDLPAHWLVPVFLGAAWSAGLAVTTDPDEPHVLAVCGPETVAARAGSGAEVVACSLLPFAVRSRDPLPGGVLDYGVLWPGQSDDFFAVEPVGPATPAWRSAGTTETQGDLLERATGRWPAGVRLLTDAHPATDSGVPAVLAPFLATGSVVLVRRPTDADWPVRHEGERASEVLRDQPISE